MYKIKVCLKENTNLPYCIIYYISTFLEKDDIIIFKDKENIYESNIITEFILRQRYKNKIEHKII